MGRSRVGVYPGTFDPVTNGHMDIIGRATRVVDRLVIGVAVLAWPDATLLVLALLIGFRTLVNGVISIGIGLNIRRYAA